MMGSMMVIPQAVYDGWELSLPISFTPSRIWRRGLDPWVGCSFHRLEPLPMVDDNQPSSPPAIKLTMINTNLIKVHDALSTRVGDPVTVIHKKKVPIAGDLPSNVVFTTDSNMYPLLDWPEMDYHHHIYKEPWLTIQTNGWVSSLLT